MTDEMFPSSVVHIRREVHGSKQGHAFRVSVSCQDMQVSRKSRIDRKTSTYRDVVHSPGTAGVVPSGPRAQLRHMRRVRKGT